MLSMLSIRDVVLIDRLEVNLAPGLSVLTGETGAGKSILLDALGLVLGSRSDARLLRQGCDSAAVAACFRISHNHPARALLRESDVASGDDEIVVRRIIGRDGRSKAYVNDQPVGVTLLRRLGQALVEVHGQFESQRLLEPAHHRALLDAFGGHTAEVEACIATSRDWRQARERLARVQAEMEVAARDEAYLRDALAELEKLAPQAGEEADLAARRALLQNAEKLITAVTDAAQELSGGRGAADILRGVLRALERIAAKAEGRLEGALAALEHALSEVSEAEAVLERTLSDADLDPRRLEEVEERLFALRKLARKHNVAADALPRVEGELAERLAAITDGADMVQRLGAEAAAAEKVFRAAALRLSQARQTCAARLDAAVAAELEPLRMGKATFRTRLTPLSEGEWGEHGCEAVEFEVATNPGAAPGPLARIASGGELARFMLALKVVLAQADPVSTLVFDEVDAGIGGAVADAVGERLARLADEVQVLVVTHSPQVAARGHHHWRISKRVVDAAARTHIEVLDEAGRTEELARMLAGARVTDEARRAARSLLTGSSAC
ncbi:MAG: DNA repair protein RecN [Rhodospirillales bacterium]|nr:DNA repair protein RecN [Rhodospirillales bacterium]